MLGMGTICKNCHSEFAGNYCPSCGQRLIERFTWRTIANDLGDALSFNRGFLFNLKQFTLHPRLAMDEYLGGRTRPYMNPISYNLAGVSLLFLSIQLLSKKDQQDLYSKAELFIYGMAVIGPVIFSLTLIAAGFFKEKYRLLNALICSLFLSGNLLSLLVLARLLLWAISSLLVVRAGPSFLMFFALSCFYTVVTSSRYLELHPAMATLRIVLAFASTILVLTFGIVLLIDAIAPINGEATRASSFDFGYSLGKVIRLLFSFG